MTLNRHLYIMVNERHSKQLVTFPPNQYYTLLRTIAIRSLFKPQDRSLNLTRGTLLSPGPFTNAAMKFTLLITIALSSLAIAAPQPQNANRPVPSGACCTPNTSLKQDVCNVNGQAGRCVPSAANNCQCH